jgi:hypothetical protein
MWVKAWLIEIVSTEGFTPFRCGRVVAGKIETRSNLMTADVEGCKTLDFARGCISMQNQLVTFRQPA